MMRMLQTLRRRMNGEGGFTIVEAMISITILAVGAFAVAQAMIFGLSTTGLSRQKLSSRAAVDQQMEEARALNYDNLVLSDPAALTHSADTTNPDYWVNASAQTYDPDGTGPLAAEPLVRVAGASPALSTIRTRCSTAPRPTRSTATSPGSTPPRTERARPATPTGTRTASTRARTTRSGSPWSSSGTTSSAEATPR